MNLDQHLASRFVCPKCDATQAKAKRFAATGAGLSKLLNLQLNKFLAVSCQNCGYTETYDPSVLEGNRHAMDVIDAVFGG